MSAPPATYGDRRRQPSSQAPHTHSQQVAPAVKHERLDDRSSAASVTREHGRSTDSRHFKPEHSEPRSHSHKRKRQQQPAEDSNQHYEWGKAADNDGESEPVLPIAKQEANFERSGKLAEFERQAHSARPHTAATTADKSLTSIYSEPVDARQPTDKWLLFCFKDDELQRDATVKLHTQSYYTVGKAKEGLDVRLLHPSVSKFHAVVQHRQKVTTSSTTGEPIITVKPYLMDLNSTNGTYLNNERIDSERYYELLERDVIKFAHSTREYVLLHEKSVDAGR